MDQPQQVDHQERDAARSALVAEYGADVAADRARCPQITAHLPHPGCNGVSLADHPGVHDVAESHVGAGPMPPVPPQGDGPYGSTPTAGYATKLDDRGYSAPHNGHYGVRCAFHSALPDAPVDAPDCPGCQHESGGPQNPAYGVGCTHDGPSCDRCRDPQDERPHDSWECADRPCEIHGLRTPVGDRARFVASLHALAEWFREHPEIPIPTSVQMHSHAHGPSSGDEVERFAKAQDIDVTRSGAYSWATLTVMAPETHGVTVEYSRFGYTRDPERPL